MANLSRVDIAKRILALPADRQARAIKHLKMLNDARDRKGAVSHAKRDPAHRRRYVGDPWAYARDVYALAFTPQQDAVIERLMREERLLIPSGNNLGKTFTISFWGLYRFDVLGAIESESESEQGARILLPGPDHDTIYATIYSEMLTLARRAELRGHLMPGERSEISVLWRVRPQWEMEAFSPPKKVQQNVAHTASGRHHRNQAALIEEGQGVPEAVWKGAEGMCSSEGNQIVSSFNPTESIGPAFQRAQSGAYAIVHLSAFDHPNIRQRTSVIPAAVALSVVENRIRSNCRDRGPFPGTPIDPEYRDFVYALPAKGAPDTGVRADGHLGAEGATLRVYRPDASFTGQVLGQWPADSETGLFNPGDWDAGVHRWKQSADPAEPPDRVGADVAREGKDESCTAPAWGLTAAALIRLHADLQEQGADTSTMPRVRVGALRIYPKGDGVDVAVAIANEYPDSPLTMDKGGVGASPYDHVNRVLKRDVVGVEFGERALPPLPGEPYCENMRTQLYVRAAMLCARGLVDPPDDPQLREEIMAHRLEYTRGTVERKKPNGSIEKVRVDIVALIPKDDIKKLIGRSPDRSDAFVLSLADAPTRTVRRAFVPASESYVSV